MKSVVRLLSLAGVCLFSGIGKCDAADYGIVWKSSFTADQVKSDRAKQAVVKKAVWLAFSDIMERMHNDPILQSSSAKPRVWPAEVNNTVVIVAVVSSTDADSAKGFDRLVKDYQSRPQIANARGFSVAEVTGVLDTQSLPPKVDLTNLEPVLSTGGATSSTTVAGTTAAGATTDSTTGATTTSGATTTPAAAG